MGQGINLARPDAPLHTAVLDDFKDQLLLALIHRLGRNITIPATEIDQTGRFILMMSVDNGCFNFELKDKQ